MELVAVKCSNCNKEIYVLEKYIREKMFCTLGCLDSNMTSRTAKKQHSASPRQLQRTRR